MSEGSTFDVEEAGLASAPSVRQQGTLEAATAASDAALATAGRPQPGPGMVDARGASRIGDTPAGAHPGAVLGMPAPGTGMPSYQGWFPGMMSYPYQMSMSMPPPMFPGYQDMCMASMMYQQQAMQQQQAMMLMMQQQAMNMHMMGKPGGPSTATAVQTMQTNQAAQAQQQQIQAAYNAFQGQNPTPLKAPAMQQTLAAKPAASMASAPAAAAAPQNQQAALLLPQHASTLNRPSTITTTPASTAAPPPPPLPPSAAPSSSLTPPALASHAPPLALPPPPTAPAIPLPNTPTSSATATSQSLPDNPPRPRRLPPSAAASVPNLQTCHHPPRRAVSMPRSTSLPAHPAAQEGSEVAAQGSKSSITVKTEPSLAAAGQGAQAEAANWVALPMVMGSSGVQGPGQVVYVSAKRAAAILRRREQRARLEAGLTGASPARLRKPYLHQSRHEHAQRRIRGPGGRFLSAQEKAALLGENEKNGGAMTEGDKSGGDGDTIMEEHVMVGTSRAGGAGGGSRAGGSATAARQAGHGAGTPDGVKAGGSKAQRTAGAAGKNPNRRVASFVVPSTSKAAGGTGADKPRRPPARDTSCVSAPAAIAGGKAGDGDASSVPVSEGRLRSKRGASKSRPPSPPLPTLEEHAMEPEGHVTAGARTRPTGGRNSHGGGNTSSARSRGSKKAAKSSSVGAGGSGLGVLPPQGGSRTLVVQPSHNAQTQSDEELLLIGSLKGSGSRTGGSGDDREMCDPALAPLELTHLAMGGGVDGGLLLPPNGLRALGGGGLTSGPLSGLPHGVEDGDEELLLMMAGDLMQDIWETGTGPLINHGMPGTQGEVHGREGVGDADMGGGSTHDTGVTIGAGSSGVREGTRERSSSMEVEGVAGQVGRSKIAAVGAPGASSEDSGVVSADTLEARVKR